MKYSEYFNNRKNTFEKTYEKILNNIDSKKTYNIVELGTSRSFVSWRIINDEKYWTPDNIKNWAWSDGLLQKYLLII